MSQASGLLLETLVKPGECVWPWGDNRGRGAACGELLVGSKTRESSAGCGGKPRSEGDREDEIFLIGQRLAQLHLCRRRWSPFLPSLCHFL